MNLSSTTTGNKTKYKLVFLGDQSVGKSCIIEKYIHNKFDDASNVRVQTIEANSRNRLPRQKSVPQKQKLPPAAMGHCRTGKIPLTHPKLP